jgi:probable HAF family extracellular repeat protein
MAYFARLIAVICLVLPIRIFASPVQGTWQPAVITQNLMSGTACHIEVVFVPNASATAVKVHLSGEISKYLSVAPVSFDALRAGVPVTLAIQVNIPKTQVAKQLSGSLHMTFADDQDNGNAGTLEDASPTKLPVSILVQVPSAAIIPSGIGLPSTDRITTDPRLSAKFVVDEVDVLFASTVPLDAIKVRASSLDLAFIGSGVGLNYFQLVAPQSGYDNLNSLIDLLQTDPNVVSASLHTLLTPFAFPNDPGNDLSYAPGLIDLPRAWDITTGSKSTNQGELSIAVIDTGFDFQHDDLIDNITAHTANTGGSQDHGTRVASIVGAKGNNGIGIAGAMWDASLHLYTIGVPGLDATSSALIAQRITQAIQDHVRVVNFSHGFDCTVVCLPGDRRQLQNNDQAYRYMFELGKDVIWVIAAGNGGTDVQNSSPARLASSLPNVIAVSAVDSNSQLIRVPLIHALAASDYGVGITVAAPGLDIESDVPGGSFNTGVSGVTASGTSFAAPYVTGTIGLMLTVNPAMAATDVKSILRGTAKHTGNFDPENNEVLLLDAFAAVQAAQNSLHPVQYTITDLGPDLNPRAVNSAGQVVGTIGFNRAFSWNNGVLTDLGALLPSALFSEAVGINESGHIAGNYTSLSLPGEHAFLISGTSVTDIGVPLGALASRATGIDAFDRIVGGADRTFHGLSADPFRWTSGTFEYLNVPFPSDVSAVSASGNMTGRTANSLFGPGQAFLLDGATLTVIGALPKDGGVGSFGFGVNDVGQVVGQSGASGGSTSHPFLWSASSGFVDLGLLPGYLAGFATSINLKGDVVGESIDFNNANPERAFIWTTVHGLQDLNDLIPESGWVLDSTNLITDSGLIVGRGRLNGQPHGFLLRPVTKIAFQ